MNKYYLWDTMTPQPSSWAMAQALIDSVTVPIWFTLSNRPEHAFFSLAVGVSRCVHICVPCHIHIFISYNMLQAYIHML
jgi:hypothetical protein